MEKHIVLTVNCANQFAGDFPDQFVIVVNETLRLHIERLAKACKELKFNEARDFCHDGTWLDEEINQDCLSDESIEKNIARMLETVSDVDCPMLCVTEAEFYFTAVPKHCGDDMLVTTARVDISELKNDDTLMMC